MKGRSLGGLFLTGSQSTYFLLTRILLPLVRATGGESRRVLTLNVVFPCVFWSFTLNKKYETRAYPVG